MSLAIELVQHFGKTFEDRKVSSSERKALKMILRENELPKAQRDFVISELFKMAEIGLGKGDNRSVLEWLRTTTQMIAGPEEDEDSDQIRAEVHFSPGRDCLGAILHEISLARKGIDICVFTISDDRISEVLIQRHLRGLPIRIISDNEKLMDRGSDIRNLSDARIPVKIDRTRNHMHHKFAIFDQEKVLTGSYNWTRSAEKYNNENILVTNNSKVVQSYHNAFNRMWPKMEDF